jgi:uncharacterized protein YjbI with pentapeptide repeats
VNRRSRPERPIGLVGALGALTWALVAAPSAAAFDAGDLERLRQSGNRSCPACDLRGAALGGVSLAGARLAGADLREADLVNVDLGGADLAAANLFGADLAGAGLEGADLTRADLGSTRLVGARLVEVDLSDANLDRADLTGADLSRATLEGSSLFRTRLETARLAGARLEGANLFEADLARADLKQVDLTHAHLGRASLVGADLRQAILLGADLADAILAGSDLSHAVLAPAALAASADLKGVRGLGTLFVPAADPGDLARLRQALAAAGLRQEERELLRAIARSRTCALLYVEPRPALDGNLCTGTLRWTEPRRLARGALRVLALEWPIAYGLRPERALWAGLALALGFLVACVAARPVDGPSAGRRAATRWLRIAAGLQLLLSAALLTLWLASRHGDPPLF